MVRWEFTFYEKMNPESEGEVWRGFWYGEEGEARKESNPWKNCRWAEFETRTWRDSKRRIRLRKLKGELMFWVFLVMGLAGLIN